MHPSTPRHRIDLDRSAAAGWSVWKVFRLRGAGFAAADVLRLAAVETASAADHLFAVEDAVALDDAERARAHDAVLACFEAEAKRARQALVELSRAPAFREAVLWQNAKLAELLLDSLARRRPDDFTAKARKQELSVASYLQRYCVKNDTIGFFGPVGWGHFVDDPQRFGRLAPGPSLVSHRQVYFEHWVIDALARRLGDDERLRPELCPRRAPTVAVDGNTLVLPIERRIEVQPEFARLLLRCDGTRSARQLAAELRAEADLELADEHEVYDLLSQLVEKKLVTWTLEVPFAGSHPEARLRALVEALPAGEAKERALAVLDELERARAHLASAAGDPQRLTPAIAAFEQIVDETIGASHRNAGATYAGRNSFFEDCRRDLDCELGRSFLERAAAPLSLVLDSARWYTHRIAAGFEAALTEDYQRVARASGSSTVSYLRFFETAQARFTGAQEQPPPIVLDVLGELHRRWSELVGLPSSSPPPHEPWILQARTSSLRARADELFAAPAPGWPSARYQSPDLMLAADGPEALLRGKLQLVLGELHAGYNSLGTDVFLAQYPAPDEIRQMMVDDATGSRVSFTMPRAALNRVRAMPAPGADHVDIEASDTISSRPRDRVIPVADLLVDERDGRVVVRSRDGRHSFPLLVFFEQHMRQASVVHFSLFARGAHRPRVVIDDLVIAREQWSFEPSELAFAAVDGAAERYLAARRWARRHRLPRFCFYKIPEEPKPVYLDFDSPIFVELLARQARRASRLVLTEMLPRHDQLWLTDGQGRRYTCELRIVAVDAKPHRG